MRTITEFNVSTLKNAQKAKDELAAAGKTAEELPAALGETLKLEGDKLTNILNALEVVGTKTHDLKRVVILALNENEKAPSGVVQKGEQYFSIEYFPPMPGQAPKGRGAHGGRDGKRGGKRGDRKGKRGRGGRGGERGEQSARGPRPEGTPGAEGEKTAGEGGENRRPRRRRPPRGPRPPRPEGAQTQAPNPNAGKKIIVPNRAAQAPTDVKPAETTPAPESSSSAPESSST